MYHISLESQSYFSTRIEMPLFPSIHHKQTLFITNKSYVGLMQHYFTSMSNHVPPVKTPTADQKPRTRKTRSSQILLIRSQTMSIITPVVEWELYFSEMLSPSSSPCNTALFWSAADICQCIPSTRAIGPVAVVGSLSCSVAPPRTQLMSSWSDVVRQWTD